MEFLTTEHDIIDRPHVGRSLRSKNLSAASGHIPPLDRLLRDGRDSQQRIQQIGNGIRKFRKEILTEWLNQAERLWLAAEHHRLKGKHFEVFATQIGIDRSSAYELLKLHPNRHRVLEQCRRDNHWPGWEVCASWYKANA